MHVDQTTARASLAPADTAVCVAVVVVSAIGAALADTAPTGHAGADVFWRVLVAVVLTCAGFTCGPVARMVPAAAAAAVAASLEAWGVAAAACAVLVASAFLPHRGRWAGVSGAALVGASVSILFRSPDFQPARVTTLVSVVSVLVVLVSGWQGAGRTSRRVALWLGCIGAGVVAAMSLPFLLAGAFARGDVNRGAGEANAFRVLTAEGEEDLAAAHLEQAGLAFAEADEGLDGWWMAPARLIPVVAQHAEAADVGVESGLRLIQSAEDILEVAEPEDLKLDDGSLDLELVDQVHVPVRAGTDALTRVEDDLDDLSTDWLFPTIQHDVREVSQQVRDAQRDAAFADRVLDVVPELVGGDEPKRYFVVFSNPAEARELGGILGNWGILTAQDGRLELEQTGRSSDLNLADPDDRVRLTDPSSYPSRYRLAKVDQYWQNLPSSPDLPTVSRAVADLYEQTTGDAIDGVLVVDPVALSALLEITGPVDVEGLDEPLTADNAVDFLLRDQYRDFPELGDRVDFLSDAAEATFDRLTQGTLPGPANIADVLGPAVTGRHLLFWSLDPDAQPLLAELGLDGTLPPTTDQDVLAVAHSNLAPNKLDAYLREDIDYDVEVNEDTGKVESEVTLTYTNEAPADLPSYVSGDSRANQLLVSVWTPYRYVGATVDGEPVSLERHVELGRNRYLKRLDVAPGETVTLTVRLDGALTAEDYRLTVVRQPLGAPSSVDVHVHDPEGRKVGKDTNVNVIGG